MILKFESFIIYPHVHVHVYMYTDNSSKMLRAERGHTKNKR